MIVGIDEAGRGALAGPVVAAAVTDLSLIPPDLLADSKTLTPSQREQAYTLLMAHAKVGIAIVNHHHIDSINILNATFLAMKRALAHLALQYSIDTLPIQIDGNKVPPGLNATAIIKGDGLVPEISAASIVAKVTRDHLMVRVDSCFPGYHFAIHKGYGTADHYTALAQLGPCPIHRKSFNLTQQLSLF